MRFGSGSSKKVSIIVKGILDICSVVLLHCLFLSLLNGNLPLRYIGLPKKQETKRLSCTTCPFLNISTRSFVEPILRGQIPYNTVPFHHLNGQQKVSPSCRWQSCSSFLASFVSFVEGEFQVVNVFLAKNVRKDVFKKYVVPSEIVDDC